jgi:nitrite reductase/ring-hydroxylating ferredoxin subunit
MVKLGLTSELSRQPIRCIQLGEQQFVLVYLDNEFALLDNLCPHKAAALCDGELDGTAIVCPWHNARFDIKTGRGLTPLAGKGIQRYPLHIENGELSVDLKPYDPT